MIYYIYSFCNKVFPSEDVCFFMNIGSFQWMKSINKSIVLNKIRMDGPISRAEIARDSQLTPPTVSSLVNELLKEELVIESERGESLGGRKPTLLIINQSRFYIIGLDVGPNQIRAALVNLSGGIEEKIAIPLSFPITNESLLQKMDDVIALLLREQGDKEIIGIGVGMHGAVDVETGTGLFAPNLHLRDIPIKRHLEQKYRLRIKVDNDVRAMALGEYWFAAENQLENLVTINIGHGVGAGIVLNGNIFHGEHDLAGEIGHMSIDLSERTCSCGNTGCWQTFISGPAIAAAAIEKLTDCPSSLLLELVADDIEKVESKTVYEAAVQGDALSIEVLEQTGEYIGIGLTNLIHLLNPNKIIIGGGVSGAKAFILPKIKETIEKRGLTKQAKSTEIICSTLGEFSTSLGAAALILSEIFEGNASITK